MSNNSERKKLRSICNSIEQYERVISGYEDNEGIALLLCTYAAAQKLGNISAAQIAKNILSDKKNKKKFLRSDIVLALTRLRVSNLVQ
jgi:hypothetical protein